MKYIGILLVMFLFNCQIGLIHNVNEGNKGLADVKLWNIQTSNYWITVAHFNHVPFQQKKRTEIYVINETGDICKCNHQKILSQLPDSIAVSPY